MKKKILVICIIVLFVFSNCFKSSKKLLLINAKTSEYLIEQNYKEDNVIKLNKFTLKKQDNSEDLKIDNALILYNTIIVPEKEIFEKIFESENRNEIEYNEIKLEIKDNVIVFPNINVIQSNGNTATLDNSVEVEIEEVNNVKYIPLYLIANLPGVHVYVDDSKIYDSNNYLSGVEAMNKESEQHSIVIELTNEKTDSSSEYFGREDGALWREEALKRIEKYRKGNVNIVLKDSNNNVIPNADVEIKMNSNDFEFGTAVRVKSNSNYVGNYNEISKDYFSILGSENGFKWTRNDVYSEGEYYEGANVEEYAKSNDMSVRGHTLWWDRTSFSKKLVQDVFCEYLETVLKQEINDENIIKNQKNELYNLYYQYANGEKSSDEIKEVITSNEKIKGYNQIINDLTDDTLFKGIQKIVDAYNAEDEFIKSREKS